MAKSIGKVSQIIGPVVDVEFNGENNSLPKIYDALEIKKEDGSTLVLEVQSHIGEETVRTISMDSTDGLSRGADATALESPIQMPIGEEINGSLFSADGKDFSKARVIGSLKDPFKVGEDCAKKILKGL